MSTPGGDGGERLGELLVREDLISLAQLQRAQDEQRQTGGRVGYHLTKLGFIEESELTEFLSGQYGVPVIDLGEFEIDEDVLGLIPKEVAEKHCVCPVNRAESSLIVAMSDPSNIFAIDDLKFLTGYNIEVVVASESAIRETLARYYSSADESSYADIIDEFDPSDIDYDDGDEDGMDIGSLSDAAEEAPVVKLVNLILIDAIKKGASDIHVEPYEKTFRVRYRVDGFLAEVMNPPYKLKNAITSRLKIMASLDIAERRLPQDGRIKLRIGKDREMDFRVSVCPVMWGEKVVLRLLDKSNLQLDMTKLGFDPGPLEDFVEAIHRPFGMVLVTGPTGSGKTTTLYSALGDLNKPSENISTAEDPIEFNFAGINQVAQNDAIGLNFAATLRSFLRQDPDIIMVGEIRDFETAEIAVKAALTGHMVLSTLHTNDAPSTISRLLNMGVEPFLVTASVNLIMAQRLARKNCKDCRVAVDVSPQVLIDMGMKPEQAEVCQVMEGKGCRTCNGTGSKGRIALYEVMPFYDDLKEYTLQGYSSGEIKNEAIRLGMITLRQAGLKKVEEGLVKLSEITRNTVPDVF